MQQIESAAPHQGRVQANHGSEHLASSWSAVLRIIAANREESGGECEGAKIDVGKGGHK
jgi:hypothetical protein